MPNYYAIGSTLAALVNMSSHFTIPPKSVRGNQPVPLLGGVRRTSLSGRLRADGFKNAALVIDFASQEQYEAFTYAVFGGFTVASVLQYMTLFDSSGHYSPFYGYIGAPTVNWETADALTGLTFPLSALALQTANKTANFTVTTSTRHLTADTSGGSITFALPAVAGVTANTLFSFVKTASANNMVIDPNGAELVAGASTLTVTAQYERVDIYTDGSAWYRI